MSLRINTNVAGLNAHKNMIKTDDSLSASLERLSSGLRINKAADDASGMAIADSLRSQGLGLGQAIRNANDGISMVQTADGALDESIKIVNTIKTKSIQAAQDGQTTESRKAIQSDIDKLMGELDNIAKTTSFNGQKLLSGQFTNKKFQIGAYSGETVGVSIGSSESTKVGHVTTAELKTSATNGGDVKLSIYSNLQNADISIQSVTLAQDNTAEHGIGALADAINRVSDLTGVTAQMKVETNSTSAVAAGTTGSDFSVNGITIGSVNVLANDADGSLVNAINQKTSQHGVTASVNENGFLNLASADGRAIKVDGDSGTTLMGSNLSTFGEVKLFQLGANEIKISDAVDNVSLNLTSNLMTSGATTTTTDSSLTANSTLTSDSVIGTSSTLGFNVSSTSVTSDVTTTKDSTLVAGSVLGSDSLIQQGSIIGGSVNNASDTTTTADSLLKTGSILADDSVLAAGTTVTTRLATTTGFVEAGTTLASDYTLSGNNTLLADMTVKKDSVLQSGSTFNTGSYVGADVVLSNDTTMTVGMTLKADSNIVLAAASNTSILNGSSIGGNVQLTATVNINRDMSLKAGSVVGSQSVLAKGSTIGGSTNNVSSATVAGDMSLAAGSILASDSTLKAGTVLTDDIWAAGGDLVKAGTVLDGDLKTTGNNYLDASMTLKANSVIASGSTLAATATSSTGASAVTALSDVKKYKLSDVDVTTQEGAQVAISIADAALKNLDKIRSDLGSVQNQLTSTITNVSATRVNINAAESSIRDVDFAEEAGNFSKMRLLAQAGSFAMAQANSSSQNVMQLLQG